MWFCGYVVYLRVKDPSMLGVWAILVSSPVSPPETQRPDPGKWKLLFSKRFFDP